MNPEVEIEVIKTRLDDHDGSLDKLGEIASYLKEIVIEHKTKIATADRDVSELKVSTATIARDLKAETADIAHSLKEETSDKFDELKRDLKDEIKSGHASLSKKIDEVIANQSTLVSDFKTTITDFGKRIGSLERYKWIIFGGATVMGFLLKIAIDLLQPVHDIISKSPH